MTDEQRLQLLEGPVREARLLCKAARQGDLARVRELVEVKGLPVSAAQADGSTALHMAARFAHVPVLEFLLARGADREATDREGRTPADAAAAGDAARADHPRHRDHLIAARALEGKSVFAAAKDGAALPGTRMPLHCAAPQSTRPAHPRGRRPPPR